MNSRQSFFKVKKNWDKKKIKSEREKVRHGSEHVGSIDSLWTMLLCFMCFSTAVTHSQTGRFSREKIMKH